MGVATEMVEVCNDCCSFTVHCHQALVILITESLGNEGTNIECICGVVVILLYEADAADESGMHAVESFNGSDFNGS